MFIASFNRVLNKVGIALGMFEARCLACRQIAVISFAMNTVFLAADQCRDMAMAQFQQVLPGSCAGREEIDRHARQLWRCTWFFPHAQYYRCTTLLGLLQLFQRQIGVHHQQTFRQAAGNLIQIGAAGIDIIVGIADDQKPAALSCSSLSSQCEFGIKRIGNARHHQRQSGCAALRECPCGQVRTVAKLIHCSQDAESRLFPDLATFAQNIGNGSGSDAGQFSNFVEGCHLGPEFFSSGIQSSNVELVNAGLSLSLVLMRHH